MDELSHQIKHAAQQQVGDYRPFVFGHIATYDPKQGVRLILPSLRDEGGNPVLTPWMPLNSTFAGAGWGFQAGPKGGATFENPTAGELCLVAVMERQNGLMAVASMLFNQVNTAPFPNMLPGEMGMKHLSGSTFYFAENGNVTMNGAQDLTLSAARDVLIEAGRNAVVHGDQGAAIDADGCGVAYTANTVKSYTQGATSTPEPINPPQIPA